MISLAPAIGCSPREQAKPGEVVLERYAGKSYFLIASPSSNHPTYRKYRSNLDRVRRTFIHEIEYAAVIELVGGKKGEVLDGPVLDAASIELLNSRYKLDPQIITILIIGRDGEASERVTGDEAAAKVFQSL